MCHIAPELFYLCKGNLACSIFVHATVFFNPSHLLSFCLEHD